MSITLVNKTISSQQALATSIASSALSTTTGNFIYVGIAWSTNGITVTGVTDTAGNSYTRKTESCITDSTGAGNGDVWYAKNITGNASNVVTANFSSTGASFREMAVAEYSGLDTTAPSDTGAVGTGTAGTGTATSGSFTTTQANEVIICYSRNTNVNPGAAWTPPSGYTNEQQDSDGITMMSDKVVSAIQTGVTLTSSCAPGTNTDFITVATFKQASTGVTPVITSTLSFMHAG